MAWASALRCERRSATLGSVAESTGHDTSYSWYFVLAFFPDIVDHVAMMNAPIKFLRRLGPGPRAINACTIALRCPDIFELESGDFAIIGKDITASAANLPPDAGCGPDERIVRIPRNLLVAAKTDIPNHV